MTRIDMAVAIASISILLCSAYAAPPIIPKAQDSHVGIRDFVTTPDDVEMTVPSISSPLSCSETCPGSPTSATLGSKTFELRCSTGDIDYAAADAACKAVGMILAKIENYQELDVVADMGLPDRAWIGITDRDTEVNNRTASVPKADPLPPHISVSAEQGPFVPGRLRVRGWDPVRLLLQ
jgi:hypothetical protein